MASSLVSHDAEDVLVQARELLRLGGCPSEAGLAAVCKLVTALATELEESRGCAGKTIVALQAWQEKLQAREAAVAAREAEMEKREHLSRQASSQAPLEANCAASVEQISHPLTDYHHTDEAASEARPSLLRPSPMTTPNALHLAHTSPVPIQMHLRRQDTARPRQEKTARLSVKRSDTLAGSLSLKEKRSSSPLKRSRSEMGRVRSDGVLAGRAQGGRSHASAAYLSSSCLEKKGSAPALKASPLLQNSTPPARKAGRRSGGSSKLRSATSALSSPLSPAGR